VANLDLYVSPSMSVKETRWKTLESGRESWELQWRQVEEYLGLTRTSKSL